MHVNEQADGESRAGKRKSERLDRYHRYLKRGRARWTRRRAKQALRAGSEPVHVGFRGYES